MDRPSHARACARAAQRRLVANGLPSRSNYALITHNTSPPGFNLIPYKCKPTAAPISSWTVRSDLIVSWPQHLRGDIVRANIRNVAILSPRVGGSSLGWRPRQPQARSWIRSVSRGAGSGRDEVSPHRPWRLAQTADPGGFSGHHLALP
jgi:hypothetical protein